MTDPRRLRDLDGAASEMGELLRAGRKTTSMPAAVRRRSAARVARLGIAPASAGVVFLLTKALLAGASIGLATVVAYRVVAPAVPALSPPAETARPAQGGAGARASSPRPAVPTVEAQEPAITQFEPASAPNVIASPAMAEAAPIAHVPTPPASAGSGSPVDDLAREAALLERARGLLATQPREALARADLHAKEFANGQLSAEREVIAIDALHRLGRTSDAERRSRALLRRFPDGIYAERVRKILDDTR